MTYSDAEMREIEKDPIRLRGYFWRVATNAQQMAAAQRRRSQRGFEPDSGALRPDILESFAETILEHLDTLAAKHQP